MIEKVARAICNERGINPDQLIYVGMPQVLYLGLGLFGGVFIPPVEAQAKAWEAFIRDAKAAILAMREPTEGMIAEFPYNWIEDDVPSAMAKLIDAALKD